MKVGFIGTGVMGSRMVKRFLEKGYPVTVYNRTPEKIIPLLEAGAVKADHFREIAAKSDVICTCLSMPEDTLNVFLGGNGVLQYAKKGTIMIDFTTVDAETSKKVYKEAAQRGIHFLDAPVSGGPEGVEQGTLTIMVGGERSAFDKVRPLLETIGTTIEYLGPSGLGSIAKLINQYLVAVHTVAASEAMVCGAALGIRPEQLYKLLKVSYGYSRMLERHMERFVFHRRFEPGGAVKYVHKDVKLANKMFETVGLKKVLGQFAEQSFAAATEKGYSELDMSAVIKPLEEICGVTVKKESKE